MSKYPNGLTAEEVKEILLAGDTFKINMAILDEDRVTKESFIALINKLPQNKMKETYERLRKIEKKRNDVMVGDMLLITSGITELILATLEGFRDSRKLILEEIKRLEKTIQ